MKQGELVNYTQLLKGFTHALISFFLEAFCEILESFDGVRSLQLLWR